MSEDKILKDLQKAVLEYDSAGAVSAAKAAISSKMDPVKAIEKGLVPSIETIGEKFEKMEIYLPELMVAADAMKSALALLLPLIPKGSKGAKATVLIGTVSGWAKRISRKSTSTRIRTRGITRVPRCCR